MRKETHVGDHGKEVNCSTCHGRKTITQSRDGKVDRIPCPLCNGTGKQP